MVGYLTTAGTMFADVFLDAPGATTRLLTNLGCKRFVFYNGTLNMNGKTLSTTIDFVVFGPAYNSSDPDRGPLANAFAYTGTAFAFTNPGSYTAAFSALDGSTIDVGQNFYVNGADMIGNTNWTLAIRSDANSVPGNPPATPWGVPYAKAFNMTVSHSQASGGFVSAAAIVGTPGTGDDNNGVTDGGNNNTNWDFVRPQIATVTTVKDDILQVTFSEPIQNGSNEIWTAATSISYTDTGLARGGSSGTLAFSGAYTDLACTTPTTGQSTLTTFYLKTTAGPWDTDIVGSGVTGVPGVSDYATIVARVTSTDRNGIHRVAVPDIFLEKALLHDIHGNPIRNYGWHALSQFSGTTDGTGAVLWKVEVGRTPHTLPVTSGFDGHNYFVLHWSEPVDIGNPSDPLNTPLGPTTFFRSQTTFSTSSERGGDMVATGTTAGSNTQIVGYFEYNALANKGPMSRGSQDGNPTANAMYRVTTYDLTIYLSGYATNNSITPQDPYLWPGWHANVPDPGAATAITVLSNPFITDHSPAQNAVDPSTVPTGFTILSSWDVDPPAFSVYISGTPDQYEIVATTSAVTGHVNRLEFHMQDNTADVASWSPGMNPDSRPNKGIRDSTLVYPGKTPWKGFSIEESGVTPLKNAYNQSLSTDVINPIFSPVNTVDDLYFSLNVDDTADPWTTVSSLTIIYDSTQGYLTDLAGNLLASVAVPLHAVERAAPFITLTLASVGKTGIYVKFSRAVYGNAARTQPIAASQFTIAGTSSIASLAITNFETDGIGANEALFTLAQPLTENQAYADRIKVVAANLVFSKSGTPMDPTIPHRITDVGIGIVTPVWASDGIHGNTTTGSTQGTLMVFDGSGSLLPRTVTLQTAILADQFITVPLALFFDANPPASATVNGFWLPTVLAGFLPSPNTEARSRQPDSVQGRLVNFTIPGNDPEVKSGTRMQFVLRIGDLYCAQLTNPNNPTTLAPWSFTYKEVVAQRAGVTILNNLINPTNNEKAFLQYSLQTSGTVTIHVFALDGSIVRVLFRGRQGAGEYTFSWDGRNTGGQIVARGIYFVRIVAPGIDETRKVLVVK
jgi:hypothetical protein